MTGWTLHPQLDTDTHPVVRWPLCDVRLMDDANHPWLILVPRVAGATELVDLDPPAHAQLMVEITRASHALQAVHAPHKLNVAALGNAVEQLHVHVIARYRHDNAWPRPVWGVADARPYAPDLLAETVARLQAAFAL